MVQWLMARMKGDILIWFVVVMLSLISLLAVYSSTGSLAYRYQDGNTEYYIFQHLTLMLMGIGLMWIAHRIPFVIYSRLAQVLVYVSIPLLILTALVGPEVNRSSRWLVIPGTSISFQTSDFAKLAVIMFTARMLSKKQEVIEDFRKGVLPVLVSILMVCGLIAPENLSTAAVLFASCTLLMFIGRVRLSHLGIIIGTMLLCVSLFFITVKAFDIKGGRIETWLNRIDNYAGAQKVEENYQVRQAQIAVATGGLLGKGPGHSVQKNFLPNSFSDFIFAIIIEEYGSLGGLFLMLLYILLLYRSIRIVIHSPRAFGALLAVGLSFSLTLQALINMGVAVHLLPVTGLTLPLVSMGGTSLWFTSIAFGIILSVSREAEKSRTAISVPSRESNNMELATA